LLKKTLQDSTAENAFKIKLCEKLAEFYSQDSIIKGVEAQIKADQILFFPSWNIQEYLSFKKLVASNTKNLEQTTRILFPAKERVYDQAELLKGKLKALLRLSAQTLGAALTSVLRQSVKVAKKRYKYGVTIISPGRQLRNNQRGPDLIIDEKRIRSEEVVMLPCTELTTEQNQNLEKVGCDIYFPPRTGNFFSNFSKWWRLLFFAIKKFSCGSGLEIPTASMVFFAYFSWCKVLKNIELDHLVTHCDFGVNHIGRNIALKQAGVATWYFTDSMNSSCNFQDGTHLHRHPFWTFLQYDHLVTWSEFLEKYYKDHPGSFKQVHIPGCLWGSYVQPLEKSRENLSEICGKEVKETFIIGVFDTTYTVQSFTSYQEGIAFMEDMYRLVEESQEIHLIFKGKKSQEIHNTLDPINGPKLLKLSQKMAKHPRITFLSNQAEVASLMSSCDMVISFPFTSTTFEFLSVSRPGIWHDAKGHYREFVYGNLDGVTTHGYRELVKKVRTVMQNQQQPYHPPVLTGASLMDPYLDGKGLDRFIDLLSSTKTAKSQT